MHRIFSHKNSCIYKLGTQWWICPICFIALMKCLCLMIYFYFMGDPCIAIRTGSRGHTAEKSQACMKRCFFLHTITLQSTRAGVLWWWTWFFCCFSDCSSQWWQVSCLQDKLAESTCDCKYLYYRMLVFCSESHNTIYMLTVFRMGWRNFRLFFISVHHRRREA